MDGKLGIIAGGGDLPARLMAVCRAAGKPFFVVALDGHADRQLTDGAPHIWSRLGAAGAMLQALRDAGVTDLVLAGRVRRPSFVELRPDWRAAKLFARIGAKALGDDGLLRAVTQELEQEGFRVLAVQDVFAGLLTPAGVLGRIVPDETAQADIDHGIRIARGLGALDVGQAVVVQQGLVLGVEAIEGTDALVERCGPLRRMGPGGVLVKMCKPQQDGRLDLPTIGPATVEKAAAAGLRGIAAEAGATLTLDRHAVVEVADRLGLFVIGVEAEQDAR
jgi:UDP-2,3-diacylglucosamine hydrolase